MTIPYEILEHTADLKIKAFGKNLPELFSNALKGMFGEVKSQKSKVGQITNKAYEREVKSQKLKVGQITNKAYEREVKSQKLKVERKVKIKSSDLESLLVDFLSEALYLSDINNEAYFEAKFDKFTKTELSGAIKGVKIKGFREEIKAVTYHGLKIEKVDGHWEAIVLFDI